MSPNPSQNYPWPAQTPSSSSPSKLKRRRPDVGSSWPLSLERRQGTTITNSSQVSAAETQCEIYANNDNVTCFPAEGSWVFQHEWAPIVWNSRRPQLTQANIAQLYLFNADTNEPILNVSLVNPTNSAGEWNTEVNDTWFGDKGLTWQPGEGDFTYPFYWVVTNTAGLDGSQTKNPIFTAIQTTYADAVVASMSSSSAAAASSSSMAALSSSLSAASASSASIASAHSSSGSSSSSPASVQQNSTTSSFPHWAIAVIVILGFFALVGGLVMIWLIMRRLRRREQLSNRGSMGSSSPMMANAQKTHSPQIPLLGGAGLAAVVTGRTSSEQQHRPESIVSPDGASEVSRTHSMGDSGPFSGADAAIMADAFRKALRKPDFAGPPVEEVDDHRDDAIMSRELKEEGRDLRSVGSSRGVRVETLGDDAADTVQDH